MDKLAIVVVSLWALLCIYLLVKIIYGVHFLGWMRENVEVEMSVYPYTRDQSVLVHEMVLDLRADFSLLTMVRIKRKWKAHLAKVRVGRL